MLLWVKQPSLSHSTSPPLPQKRKLFCQQIHGLPIYRPCQREAVEKKTGGNMILSLRPSQVLCCICLQQKLVKFPLQLWRYRAYLKHGFYERLPCDHQMELMTFARPLTLWDKQGSRKANNIIRLAWISSSLKEIRISLVMAGGAFPRLLVPPLILNGRPNYFTRSGDFKK